MRRSITAGRVARNVLIAAVIVSLTISCRGNLSRARTLIANGELHAAETLLVKEIEQHPTRLDAYLLLGESRLLRNRPEDAAQSFRVITPDPRYAKRVADVYWRAASSKAAAAEPSLAAHCLLQSAKLDPELAQPACMQTLTLARRLQSEHEGVGEMLSAAGSIDMRCRRKVVSFAESALRHSANSEESAFAATLASTAIAVEPAASPRIARAMRDRAADELEERPDLSLRLLKHALLLDGSIAHDPDSTALRDHFAATPHVPLTPLAQAPEEFPNHTPLQATIMRLDAIGGAIFDYMYWKRRLPPASNITELERALVPEYLRAMPLDGWGTSFVYVHDGWHIRLISAGADRILTPQSTDLTLPARGLMDPGGADIIWEDGAFTQTPPTREPETWMRGDRVR